VHPRKLKAFVKKCFVSKIILFLKTFEFKHVIAFSYGRQQSLTLQGYVPSFQVLSNSPCCWQYPKAHGSAKCAEPKSRMLVVLRCPCYRYKACILDVARLFGT
jgi:hypothetical protein